jgi:CheY-like chemotaxis protein
MGTVLIVEGDEARRAAFDGALKARGFETVVATDPLGAMGAVRGGQVDVVVASAGAGVQALTGVCQLARRRKPDIAICVLDAPKDDATALDEGVPGGCAFFEGGTPEQIVARVAEGAGGPRGDGEARVVVAAPAPKRKPPTGGALSGDGARWLMVYSAHQSTGSLEVEGGSFDRIYLHEGAPVWLAPKGGDRAMYELLRAEKLLLPDDPVESVPEGGLLANLYARGVIAPALVQRFMRAQLKVALTEVLELQNGQIRYSEKAPEGEPIVKVNPFGMIFEHQRSTHTPDALLRKGRTMRGVTAHPRASLGPAREAVRPFVRGLDVTDVVDGRTIEAFNEAVGHDEVMGTTVILALEAAGLCELEGVPSA